MSDYGSNVPFEETPGGADVPEVADDNNPEDRTYPDPEEPALPGDRPVGVEAHGTTAEEEAEGESLDEKLARELPDDQAGGAAQTATPVADADDTEAGTDAASASGADLREV